MVDIEEFHRMMEQRYREREEQRERTRRLLLIIILCNLAGICCILGGILSYHAWRYLHR